jgi:hypothetical protein
MITFTRIRFSPLSLSLSLNLLSFVYFFSFRHFTSKTTRKEGNARY